MKKILLTSMGILLIALSCLAQDKVLPSGELQKKFKTISDKICWEIMLEQNKIAKQSGQELPESQLKMTADTVSSELMKKYKNAFSVPDDEAENLLSGKYNDLDNQASMLNCVREFSALNVMLPVPIQYLIEKSHKQKLTGLELEFTTRLFKEYLKQSRG